MIHQCLYCECLKCGNKVWKAPYVIYREHTCGCRTGKTLRGKNNKLFTGYEEISGGFWCVLKREAKNRKIKFDIDIEYIWDLYLKQNKQCKYSKLPIGFQTHRKDSIDNKTASLDRIDSTKGYIKGNVQWVHKRINSMKNNYTESEFIELCKLVYLASIEVDDDNITTEIKEEIK